VAVTDKSFVLRPERQEKMGMGKMAKQPSLFERLKAGLEEGILSAQGKMDLRTTEVPDRPPAMAAADVTRLRQQCQVSQAVFAQMLNVSLKTVQCWEQGEHKPSQAALRLLQILEADPAAFSRIIGLRPLRGRKSSPNQL
jgi:putative transcriptional regulator